MKKFLDFIIFWGRYLLIIKKVFTPYKRLNVCIYVSI